MKVEVLVATVNADINKLINQMNIQTDAIIVNQGDKHSYEEIKHKGRTIKVYNFKERGVGLSRNTSLMRATSDIVLFADDDEVLVDNYENIIVSEFLKNKKADMIVFDLISSGGTRKAHQIKKNKKLGKYNSLKYGAVRFAVKLDKIRKNNISFSLLFGGGCQYGSGEDSIFIYDCIKRKMNVRTSSTKIAVIDFSDSTWFKGYNNKFYFDKGALFHSLHGNACILFSFIYLLTHVKEKSNLSFREKFSLMCKGYLSMKGSN